VRILVTGVYGFIGSHFARYVLQGTDYRVVGFDRDTNQQNKRRIEDFRDNDRFLMVHGDLRDDISGLTERIDVVVHFAAETFVDHSIRNPEPFVTSNVVGTYHLLEDCRRNRPDLFIQISTDEVYGPVLDGFKDEQAPVHPGNPYSATKAGAEALVVAYHNTFGLPCILTRTENNYGSWQHPQKAIPTFVRCCLEDRPLPVYGDGEHRRQWFHVEDHCGALLYLIHNGARGETYNIGGREEKSNNEIAWLILDEMGKPKDFIEYIPDAQARPGHDRRYGIDCSKIRALGWKPRLCVDRFLPLTVSWYRNNQWWFV
jgi:dTDP-glucose 4,6-dehydratase